MLRLTASATKEKEEESRRPKYLILMGEDEFLHFENAVGNLKINLKINFSLYFSS